MNNNLTILVNSRDKYEDAWDPFFRILNIQWQTCPYPIVLVTEEKNYRCPYMPVTTIQGGQSPWGSCILKALEKIESEYVIYILEDEFLKSPVNEKCVMKMLKYMSENSNVGVIFLRHSEKQNIEIDEPYFDRDRIVKNGMRIVGLSALYRKSYFAKLLRKHESPWEYEKYASIRSRKMPFRVLQYNRSQPIIFDYDDSPISGYGLTGGKWVRGTERLFATFGISVDFDRLGWYTPSYADYEKYASVHGVKLDSILPPVLQKGGTVLLQQNDTSSPTPIVSDNLTGFKWVKEKLYFLKWLMKQFRKKTVKIYRRFLSLR